jgi:hypothetical protein
MLEMCWKSGKKGYITIKLKNHVQRENRAERRQEKGDEESERKAGRQERKAGYQVKR